MVAQRNKRKQTGKVSNVSGRWLPLAITLGSFAVLFGLVGAAYAYLSQPGRLPLRVVQVQGEFQHLSRAAIQETAGAVIDGGFFTCDMQKLRRAVIQMPWVEDVSIRRVWPDKLVMNVTEQVPFARWGDTSLINVRAGVFSPGNIDDYANLVRLSGPAGSEQRVVAFYQAAVPAARARDLHINEIELDVRRHWWVRFDRGLTLSLGREDRDRRMSQFLRVYPRLVADPARQPERVDMRYEHGFAVRWREAETEAAAVVRMQVQEKV